MLDIFNEFFTWIFFVEMVFKLIGLGFTNYRKDPYNLFDAVIVIISLVDWTISRLPGVDAGAALNAFRALRLLRMMKLSKSWAALQDILRKTAASLAGLANFSLLMFLFMYIFALLGMELFANIALVDEDDNLVAGEEAVVELYASGDYFTFPRDNFNNVGNALTTIFIAIIGEDWNWTMYQWVRAYGVGSQVSYYIAIFFFLLLMIFGNIVLFSLFTAVLLSNFEGGDEEEEEEEEGEGDDLKRSQTFSQKYFSKAAWEDFKTSFKEAFGKKKRVPKVLIEEDPMKKLEKLRSSALELDDEDVGDDTNKDLFKQELPDDSVQAAAHKKKLIQFKKSPSLMHYELENTLQ